MAARPAEERRGARPGATVQVQARALGDPTRFRIFRFVLDAEAPVRVAALTEHLQLNHNAVRQHLAKLCDAGLLIEEFASRAGPGRPPLEYRPAPTALGTWATSGPYEFLALLLLDVAADRLTPYEAGAEAGRRLRLPAGNGPDPVDALAAEMARRGFEPRRVERPPFVELVLDRCPFEAAAHSDPEIVCAVHRGLAAGVLDNLGADVEVVDLIAHDPSEAGCRLQLRPRPAPETEEAGTPV
jgi:predicted ArsR family transcriptional regulator